VVCAALVVLITASVFKLALVVLSAAVVAEAATSAPVRRGAIRATAHVPTNEMRRFMRDTFPPLPSHSDCPASAPPFGRGGRRA
jgi:hypothetical protein